MTEQQTEPERPAPTVVRSDDDARLAALHLQHARAKAEAAEAIERFEAVKAGLKLALNTAAPDARLVQLTGTGLPTLELVYSPGAMRLNTAALKAEDPLTYVKYAKRGAPSWTLRVAKGAES